MKKEVILLIGSVLLCVGACTKDGTTVQPQEPIIEDNAKPEDTPFSTISLPKGCDVVREVNTFTQRAFAELYDSYDGNVVFSPLSVVSTLAMAANGDNGETRDEILKVLDITTDRYALEEFNDYWVKEPHTIEQLNEFCRIMLSRLPEMDNQCRYLYKGSVWHNPLLELSTDFSSMLATNYFAEDVACNPSGAEGMSLINSWVNDATAGVIPSLLDTPLSGDVALMNAVSFQGTWLTEIDPDYSEELPFHNHSGGESNREFFQTKEKIKGIYCLNGVTYVILEFGNSAFQIEFMIPDEDKGLDWLVHHLRDHSSGTLITHSVTEEFKVRLPEFKAAFNQDLQKNLRHLGITKAFESGFSGILESGVPMPLGTMQHGVSITVDREGARAEAASAGELLYGHDTSQKIPRDLVTFDRPFLYTIREYSTQIPLFMGCVREL